MIKLINKFKKSGYHILKLNSNNLLKNVQENIFKSKIDVKNFDESILKIQNHIFKTKIHKKIVLSKKKFFKNLFNIKNINDLNITSFFHLRAVKKSKKENFIGFHRETFYSDYDFTKKVINVSVPLLNYSAKNSMKVIDGSHIIPDEKIKTKKLSSKISGVKKNSIKHKLGMPYNPKIIISGINIKKAKRLKCSVGDLIIFSAMLIHGGGINYTNKVRFSLDFALIDKRYLKNKKLKKHHISYSNNKNYWTNI
tara:strand:- start:662 stop:1420 length:759 start_codon:yes stop_codon:yes gene_type:complete